MTLSSQQRTPSDSPTDIESSSSNNNNNNHTTFLPPSITVVNHNDSTSLSTYNSNNNNNNIPNKTPVFLRNPTTTTTSSTSQQQAFLPRRKVNTGGNGLLKWYQITAQSDFRKNHLPSYQLFTHHPPHPMSLSIPKSEVKKHNTEDDCWIIIRGIVYDITPYLKFHPGGVEKLMLGAGRDATQLFDKYHSWVNLDRLLEKCIVGRLSSEC